MGFKRIVNSITPPLNRLLFSSRLTPCARGANRHACVLTKCTRRKQIRCPFSSCPPHNRTRTTSSPGHGLFILCLVSERKSSEPSPALSLPPSASPVMDGPDWMLSPSFCPSSFIPLVGSKWSESYLSKMGTLGHLRFTSHQESHWWLWCPVMAELEEKAAFWLLSHWLSEDTWSLSFHRFCSKHLKQSIKK